MSETRHTNNELWSPLPMAPFHDIHAVALHLRRLRECYACFAPQNQPLRVRSPVACPLAAPGLCSHRGGLLDIYSSFSIRIAEALLLYINYRDISQASNPIYSMSDSEGYHSSGSDDAHSEIAVTPEDSSKSMIVEITSETFDGDIVSRSRLQGSLTDYFHLPPVPDGLSYKSTEIHVYTEGRAGTLFKTRIQTIISEDGVIRLAADGTAIDGKAEAEQREANLELIA